MPIQLSGLTGPQVLQDGASTAARQGRTGELVVQELHGRYYEQVYRGNTYAAANTASQVLTLGVAAATGLILSNPLGSGKNLAILEICSYVSAAITGVANVALYANINPVAAATTHTTPIVPVAALLGSGNVPVAKADASATLPAAPTLVRSLYGWHWVTAGTPAAQFGVKDVVDGALLVAPGCAVSVQGVTVASSAISSITWEEVPI
jgi:hypothetical protein